MLILNDKQKENEYGKEKTPGKKKLLQGLRQSA